MPLRDIGTATYNGGSSQTITIPATAEVGDFATLLVVCRSTISTDLSTDGWTLHGETSPLTSAGNRIVAWTKVVTAPDIGATITITIGSTGRWAMAVMVRYGVNGLDTAPEFTTSMSTTTAVTAPGVTSTTNNAELVSIYGCQPNDNGAISTFTMPVGQDEIADICSSSGGSTNVAMAIGEEVLGIAGASGTRTATADVNVRSAAITFAYEVTSALPSPSVQVRQGGIWVEKPLKARSGGVWA